MTKRTIKYIVPFLILLVALLHYVGVAAFVFDIIPEEYRKIYFYNADRLYLIIIFTLIYIQNKRPITMIESNKTNIAILFSAIQAAVYFLCVNSKYFIGQLSEIFWIVFFAVIFIVSLIGFRLCQQLNT